MKPPRKKKMELKNRHQGLILCDDVEYDEMHYFEDQDT